MRNFKKNIVLIGFMGTGKTYIGNLLAKQLNLQLIETDKLIEKIAGKTIPTIFAIEGEIRFREWEIEVCKQVSQYKNVVIACGGGVILNKINIDYLKQEGLIICLAADPNVIYSRILKDGKEERPLLNNPSPEKAIKELLEFRIPLYKAYSDIIIDTNRDSALILEDIIHKYKIS